MTQKHLESRIRDLVKSAQFWGKRGAITANCILTRTKKKNGIDPNASIQRTEVRFDAFHYARAQAELCAREEIIVWSCRVMVNYAASLLFAFLFMRSRRRSRNPPNAWDHYIVASVYMTFPPLIRKAVRMLHKADDFSDHDDPLLPSPHNIRALICMQVLRCRQLTKPWMKIPDHKMRRTEISASMRLKKCEEPFVYTKLAIAIGKFRARFGYYYNGHAKEVIREGIQVAETHKLRGEEATLHATISWYGL
jgi:hypothetical protein